MNGRGAWFRLWWVWAVPAVLVVANAVWLFGFHGAAVGGTSFMARSVEQQERAVNRLENQRRGLDETTTGLESLEANLAALRDDQLGSMRERLVPFLVDVVSRARQAGLQPERISYAAVEDRKTGIVHFTATYSLEGTYDQIRYVIYLLEDSPQFVVLERLSLRGQEDASSLDVAVQLGVGTYFADVDEGLMKQYGVKEVTDAAD